jgi:hypothetical protein
MHATDWLPSLLSLVDGRRGATTTRSSAGASRLVARAAGRTLKGIDGIDVWAGISAAAAAANTSARSELVYNIEPTGLHVRACVRPSVRPSVHSNKPTPHPTGRSKQY